MKFELRTGPRVGTADATEGIPEISVPEWFRDSKFGIFMHWGLYSVPAYAELPPEAGYTPIENAYRDHQYAEWYANTVRIEGSGAHRYHRREFGVGTSYEDLAEQWEAPRFDAALFAEQFRRAGARYAVIAAKHHDGFCLWNTATTTFNSARRGPQVDAVAEIAGELRERSIRLGLYYSGALDWHVSESLPAESDAEVFRYRRNDRDFARYCAAQVDELVERFEPDLLWNDLDWPDSAKTSTESWSLGALLKRYFQRKPDAAINDRWGIPAHGFITREYSAVHEVAKHPWEACRGLGKSFGINQREDVGSFLRGRDVVHLLADTIGKNGNLLLNVGPRADGSIPEWYQPVFETVGQWIEAHGAAVYGTRPWYPAGARPNDDHAVTAREGAVYLFALRPENGTVSLPGGLAARRAHWMGDPDQTPVAIGDRTSIEIPEGLEDRVVPVLEMTI